MIYPTPEEIKASYDAITADGEGSEATTRLCMIILTDPLLREKVVRFTKLYGVSLEVSKLLQSSLEMSGGSRPAGLPPGFEWVLAIMASGMNHGLRIGEARAAAAANGTP